LCRYEILPVFVSISISIGLAVVYLFIVLLIGLFWRGSLFAT
jgi:hypothetical protein